MDQTNFFVTMPATENHYALRMHKLRKQLLQGTAAVAIAKTMELKKITNVLNMCRLQGDLT